MKRTVSLFMSLLLTLSLFVINASAAPRQNADLPTYGIVAHGDDVVVPKEELRQLLTTSPTVANMPRFTQKLNQEGDRVVLTANDLLYLWLYDGEQETIQDEINFWKNKSIEIKYQDYGYFVTDDATTTVVPRGGAGYVYRTKMTQTKIAQTNNRHALNIYVTARFKQIWQGGSVAYSEYVDYSTKTEEISGYYRDTIAKEMVENSYGQKPVGTAWMTYQCKGGKSGDTSDKIKITG